jgi:hypothetical protein
MISEGVLKAPRVFLLALQVFEETLASSNVASATRALMECLRLDPKVRRLLNRWELEEGTEAYRACNVLQTPQDPSLVREAIETLAQVAAKSTASAPKINPRTLRAQEAASFCVEVLMTHLKSLTAEQSHQFRKSEKIAFCQQEARTQGRPELLASLTEGLFTLRVIPELKRRLQAQACYTPARRPHKP